MTLRKRVEALLKDVPYLTTYNFDGSFTLDKISLSLDNSQGAAARIEEEVSINGAAGDSVEIGISATLDLNDDGVMKQKEERMILIPATTARRYEDLIRDLRQAMTLRALLEDELGEERAAEICAAIERDQDRQNEEDPSFNTPEEIGRRISESISEALRGLREPW